MTNIGVAAAVLNVCSGLSFGAVIPCMLNMAWESVPGNTMTATTSMILAIYLGQALAQPMIGAIESSWKQHWGIVSFCIAMLITALFGKTAAPKNDKKRR